MNCCLETAKIAVLAVTPRREFMRVPGSGYRLLGSKLLAESLT